MGIPAADIRVIHNSPIGWVRIGLVIPLELSCHLWNRIVTPRPNIV